MTAASGNTVIAGTLGVTGAFESTGVATLADASVTKTTAAPGADAQIANKKYVDDNDTPLSVYTAQDSESNAMAATIGGTTHAYEAQTDGLVYVYARGTANEHVSIYVHTSSDAAGAGTLIQHSDAADLNHKLCISAAVAAGEFFEVTSNCSVAVPVILWKSLGTLSKPIDRN